MQIKWLKRLKDLHFYKIGLEKSPPTNDVKKYPSVLNHLAH